MKNDRNDFHEKIEVYEVLDEIENMLKSGTFKEGTIPETVKVNSITYTVSILEDSQKPNTYTVTKDGETILTFTVDNNTITSWRD
jgi:hypothetical protein